MNGFQKYWFLCLNIIFLLNGCGSSSNVIPIDVTSFPQPRILLNEDIRGIELLSRGIIHVPIVSSTNTEIQILLQDLELTNDKHYQFFLNTDNDSTTGYQFGIGVWSEVGADFLIEDGGLYKATSNDTNWSWQYVANVTPTLQTSSTINLKIEKRLLANLSNSIKLGFVLRDDKWSADAFYPQSALLSSYVIDSVIETDTTAPVITLNGSETLRTLKGSTLYDLGVTVLDNKDGDISSRVTLSTDSFPSLSTDTVGTYYIKYSVSDNAGNSSSVYRAYTVVDSTKIGIVVDGKTDDWQNLSEAASSSVGSIKVSSDFGYINILIEADEFGEHTQILLDTDDNINTGMQFFGGDWDFGGVDYMIEDRDLNKSDDPFAWSWKYDVAPIDFIKKDGVIEIAILKSHLENFSSSGSIKIGFVSRDENWSIDREILPATGMANISLVVPSTTMPTNIIAKLCENPKEVYRSDVIDNFSDGFEYKDRRYFSEVSVIDGIDTNVIKTQKLDGTDEKQIFSLVNNDFRLVSLNGAIVFGARDDFVHPRVRRKLYRINEQFEAVEIPSYKTNFNAYIDGRNYGLYTFEDKGTQLVSDNGGTLFWDKARSVSTLNDVERVQMVYENGVAYYAYTLGQIQRSPSISLVGPRILGVINDSSGLKPLSVCKN